MSGPPPIIHLHDGTRVLLRLMGPEDRERVEEAFRRLSRDSRYYRLWSSQLALPDSLLNRFLNSEPGRHETWAALDPDVPKEPGFGGARPSSAAAADPVVRSLGGATSPAEVQVACGAWCGR